MLCHAAEDQFPESRMTIGAGNNDTGADVGSDYVQLSGRVLALIRLRHEFGSGNTVT